MITHTPEYQLVQNPALGSLCLWAFARRYWEDKQRGAGAPMVLAPCVLPVTFHRETVDLLYRRRFDGGLLNALAEDRAFPRSAPTANGEHARPDIRGFERRICCGPV